MIQLTRYRSFLSFSTLYHARFFERICNDFHGLKFCSVILQFAVWEGMSLPCLPPGSRLPSPSSLGPFPTTEGPRSNYCNWDDGRQLTDDGGWLITDYKTADRQVPRGNSMERKTHITIIRTKTRPGEFFPNGSGSNQSLSLLVSVSLQPMIKGIETGSIQTTFPHQLDIRSDNY